MNFKPGRATNRGGRCTWHSSGIFLLRRRKHSRLAATHHAVHYRKDVRSDGFIRTVARLTTDELPAPSRLTLETRLNGHVAQHSTTDLLITNIPALIRYCSTILPLCPGDVIVTGTPAGVGANPHRLEVLAQGTIGGRTHRFCSRMHAVRFMRKCRKCKSVSGEL